jgi:hypothetical protein
MSVPPQELISALRRGAARAEAERRTISEFLEELGDNNVWLICLLLTLPFVQPIATGPFATAGGLAFAGIGWRLARGDSGVWLPEKIRRLRPGHRTWRSFASFGAWLLGVLGRVCVPGRMSPLVDAVGVRGAAWAVVAGGVLLAVPWVLVPLSNSLPALIVLFACLARLQRDGLMLIVAAIFTLLTLAYFGLAGWAMFWAGEHSLLWLRQWMGR